MWKLKTDIFQHTPLQYLLRMHGVAAKKTNTPDTSPPLNAKDHKRVQQITGNFLYYGRAVDPLILHALSGIVSEQSNTKQANMQKFEQLLDYMSWHENKNIHFYQSEMILQAHSDASYITANNSRNHD